MSLYVEAINYGKGFITAEDKAKGSIVGYPGNIWVVADNMGAWVGRVGGMRVTKSDAQTLVNTAVAAQKTEWAAMANAFKNPPTETGGAMPEPLDITLP